MKTNPRNLGPSRSVSQRVLAAAGIALLMQAGFAVADPGINTRPDNLSCLAPARPDAGTLSLFEPFPDLNTGGTLTVEYRPGDSQHMYLMHRDGRIFRALNDSNTSNRDVVADLRDLFGGTSQEGQSGMMDMAFHPDFDSNGELYVAYTVPGSNRTSFVARYTSNDNGESFSSNGRVILSLAQSGTFHGVGSLFFGNDGYLYISFGDAQSAEAAQDPFVFNGKILRIDVNSGNPYSIPGDNPFASGGGAPEVYAMGFRNPWRVTQDPVTGKIWAGDVGAQSWEEVNLVTKGANYGWPVMEGMRCVDAGCDTSGFTLPVHEYSHDDGCAIIGGHTYRGSLIPSLIGKYLFADVCTGDVFSLDDSGSTVDVERIFQTGRNVRDFSETPDNELFIATSGNRLLQLMPDGGGGNPGPAFPSKLSDTGCFDDADISQVASGVIPYDLNSPLWSDGTTKRRWFAIPDGSTIAPQADGDWEFPIGSVLIKEFSWNGTPFETRLFVRHDDGAWAGYTYEWNASLTDADLVPGSGKDKLIDGELDWTYPSQGQCLQCHSSAAGRVLGPETAQLNRLYDYPSGITSNQLETLVHIGLFSSGLGGAPGSLPALAPPGDTSSSLHDRSRSYLHANCANCHRPGGPGQGPMDFRFQTAFEDTGSCDVAPENGDLGVVDAKIIAPGDAASSIVALRMQNITESRMPPLGSNIVDTAGTNLINAWINSLSSCSDLPGPGDSTPPVIVLTGGASVTVTVGNAYSDFGATATDDLDGDITANIVTTSNVDTSIAGTYQVTFNVSDAAGNAATQVVRTVIVTAAAAPPPPATSSGGGGIGAATLLLLLVSLLHRRAFVGRRAAGY